MAVDMAACRSKVFKTRAFLQLTLYLLIIFTFINCSPRSNYSQFVKATTGLHFIHTTTPASLISSTISKHHINQQSNIMRFILLLKSDPESESGVPPPASGMQALNSFDQSMHEAGVVLSAEGLHASSKDSARVTFHSDSSSPPDVKSGPFTPAEDLVAGFWIIQVKDLEEALGWVKKCPIRDEGGVIEVRRVVETDDFETATEEIKGEIGALRKETEERVRGMQK